jgi:hydrogenase maturation protease
VGEWPGPVLVIACGNLQRGDDGVAWRVLDALEASEAPHDPRPLRLLRVPQLVPELAELVSGARGVIFVDARADGSPGTVGCQITGPGVGPTPLSHALTPPVLLLYAERLFARAPRAAVVTIVGTRFGHEDRLAPETALAVPAAVRRIRRLARLWTREPLTEPSTLSGVSDRGAEGTRRRHARTSRPAAQRF